MISLEKQPKHVENGIGLSLLLVLLLLLSGCLDSNARTGDLAQTKVDSFTPALLTQDSILIAGTLRRFEFFVPKDLEASPSLVFVLHGSNGNIPDTRRYTGYEFERIAAQHSRHIIVYPEGYDRHWNDCRMHASYRANQEDIDDISFFSAMIAHFQEAFLVEKDAVFVTGISNGGHMCYKLAYELPGEISGIAPFVANIPQKANNDCTPSNTPINVMIINGTTDPINPYAGGWVVLGQDSSRGSVLSTEDNLEYWKSISKCTERPEVIEYENTSTLDSSSVIHYKFTCSQTQTKVELVKVINGGHTVPLTDNQPIPENIKKFVGNKNLDINGPQLVLDFFDTLR